MKEFFYCTNCLTTSLRPNAKFDENGLCRPCHYALSTRDYDYDYQFERLKMKIESANKSQNAEHDCIIGVSGGKDSTRQALWVRDQLGLNPLLVCCSYPPKQILDIGSENIANLISCGFDIEIYNPAPETAARLSLAAFKKFGNVMKASEIALFSAVPRIAIDRGITVIFFGENPALQEGDNATLGIDEFDANMLRGLNTLSAGGQDWIIDHTDPCRRESYRYPSKGEFQVSGLQMLYLGPAWPDWDMDENAYYSVLNGLVTRTGEEKATGDITNASMLDEEFTNINMMIKYYKFGFGRATDLCNEMIRAKKLSRSDAIEIVKQYDGICSDATISRYCRWVDIKEECFWMIVNSYVNPMLFVLGDRRPVPKFQVGTPICR